MKELQELLMGYGDNIDMFFAMEDKKIVKIFYNEFACKTYVKTQNKKRLKIFEKQMNIIKQKE